MRQSSVLSLLGFIASGLATITDGEWKQLADIPYNVRQEHFVVSTNNDTIYIMGGIIPTDPAVPNVTTTINIVQSVSISNPTHVARLGAKSH